jgi:exopolysaccharide biosynthesis polyprenyl glycosylphosphotransferase
MKDRLPLMLVALADTSALAVAGFLGYQIRVSALFVEEPYIKNPQQYLFLLGVAIIVWHLICFLGDAYKPGPAIFRIDELLFHFKAGILLLFSLMALTFLYKSYDFSRLIVFFSWLALVLLGNIFRQIAFALRAKLYRNGIATRSALIYGDSENIHFLTERIQGNSSLGLRLCEMPAGKSLQEFVADEKLDELFVAAESTSYDEIWKIRESALNPGMRINVVPTIKNLYLRNLKGLFFDGMVLISLESIQEKRFHLFLKRAFDISFSVLALVAFSPLFLIIALLIKLDSKGPVFFKQNRVGQNGGNFSMLKFRTMSVDAEAYAETPKDPKDPRITRLGRFLRSTGLDELPQLFNVIGGSMSIVGPRPEMPFIVEKYNDLERQRLKARPGITGLWQVYARTENLPIHHHIEYDLYYIENFSILLDLVIVLETIPTAILRTGT